MTQSPTQSSAVNAHHDLKQQHRLENCDLLQLGSMAAVSLSVHGLPAHAVYRYFKSSSEAKCKFRTKELLIGTTFHRIHQTYYSQTLAQLHAFVDLLRPTAKNGKSAATLRQEFFLHHEYLTGSTAQ